MRIRLISDWLTDDLARRSRRLGILLSEDYLTGDLSRAVARLELRREIKGRPIR